MVNRARHADLSSELTIASYYGTVSAV